MVSVGFWSHFGVRVHNMHTERMFDRGRERYPDTGGNPVYILNWYANHGDDEARAFVCGERKQADKIQARINCWSKQTAHKDHIREGADGRYLWCEYCQQSAQH